MHDTHVENCYIYLHKETKIQVTTTINGNMPALQYTITERSETYSKNSPAVKSVRPPRRPLWKKMWNPRWWPRNGCDRSRLIAKNLIITIQAIWCWILVKRGEGITNLPELLLLKFLLLTYHHSHFLAATLNFTSFSQWPSWGLHTFFTAGLFLD